ncbi:unnamed protein product [Linum trigynum]|uniref:Uncharacterized protein n=1 Tax=Linum trigynum TaxID=586398 RepID=A0AAV2FEC7_9ROSI
MQPGRRRIKNLTRMTMLVVMILSEFVKEILVKREAMTNVVMSKSQFSSRPIRHLLTLAMLGATTMMRSQLIHLQICRIMTQIVTVGLRFDSPDQFKEVFSQSSIAIGPDIRWTRSSKLSKHAECRHLCG